MKKTIKRAVLGLLLLFAAFLYYYITIPAFNLHSIGTWWFIIGAVLALVSPGSCFSSCWLDPLLPPRL